MYHCQSWSIRLTLDTDRKHRDPPESNGKSTRLSAHLQPANFGLLPEPERSTVSFVTSAVVNGMMLALLLYVGATARHVIQQHQIEQTILIIPDTKEPPPPPKVKLPEPPKIDL